MSTLVEFLNAVDSDATLSAKYQKDPEGTMKEYGLTDEQIQAVMSKDTTSIAKAAGIDEKSMTTIQMPHTAYKE